MTDNSWFPAGRRTNSQVSLCSRASISSIMAYLYGLFPSWMRKCLPGIFKNENRRQGGDKFKIKR